MFLNVCVKESTNTGKSCTKKPYQAYVSINFALKIIGNGKKKSYFFSKGKMHFIISGFREISDHLLH